jgi:antitoxin (DNA-binding transcriptional repressor) of toxin-antitoxin stability system
MTIVITRRGQPVARLIPFSRPRDQVEIAPSVRKLRAFGKGIKLPKGLTIKDLIEDGRP